MDMEEIKSRIGSIKAMAGDDEVAHSEEDALYTDFIRYVAEVGPTDLAEKANAVLETAEIDFARWCA